MALNCFRYLDFKNFDQVDLLTFAEYELLMKAVELKEIDLNYHIHLLAFSNFRVKAKKKAGRNKTRPVYSTFKKFFDYEYELNKVLGKKEDKFSKVKEFIRGKR